MFFQRGAFPCAGRGCPVQPQERVLKTLLLYQTFTLGYEEVGWDRDPGGWVQGRPGVSLGGNRWCLVIVLALTCSLRAQAVCEVWKTEAPGT